MTSTIYSGMTDRKSFTRATTFAAAITLSLGLGGFFGVAGATATTLPTAAPTNQIIAEDLTALKPTAKIAAVPNAPGSLAITAPPGSTIKLKAPGSAAKSVTANKKGTATAKNLVAGRNYTITAGHNRTTAMPVVPVTAATGLRVATTQTPGNVELTWKHSAAPAQGAVKFTVTATPVSDSLKTPSAKDVTVHGETTQHSIVLLGLDLSTRYQFTVTPVNALGAGTATTAIMASTLGDITGATVVEQPAPAIKPAPASSPQPANPQPAPAPVGPSTRTIYVCPDGFSEAGNLCEKITPYTYTTLDYTFHSETRTEACAGPDCPGSYYRSYPVSEMAPHCPQGGTIHGKECAGWTDGSRTVTYQVKDSAPAGFSDNGTEWIKKNDMPAGYTDNGTAWVRTTAKEARVVPA